MLPENAQAPRPEDSARYERKFAVRELDRRAVELAIRLHPALWRDLHQPRWVNNLYFDTPGRDHYRANEIGLAERHKLRVRWYGAAEGPVAEPRLELKSKHGLVGTKVVLPLEPFELGPDFRLEALTELVRRAARGTALWPFALDAEPSLAGRYRRRYWRSADGAFRLTLDWAIESGAPASGRAGRDSWWRERTPEAGLSVVELKYAREHDAAARDLAAAFPFRATKNSKYASGIERLARP